MAMDAKDLTADSAITATISDGNANYDQGSTTLQSNRNKLYQDIGSNSFGKVEAQGARPCAIIGPDRVLPPPTPTPSDAYLKKASVEPWPNTDNVYTPQSDFPQKLPNYQSVRNISPRQTFQENMQRIMVPPSYHTKNVEDNSKSSKVDMPLEVKYYDVPYTVNPTVHNQKSIRTSDVPITGTLPFARGVQPHVWSGGVSVRTQKPYASEFYQFPEFANYSGPRAIQRFHRPSHDDPAQIQHDRLYHEANVRFKPYPSAKERYPQHRYDYMNNYTNTYHPQAPFPPQKYDINKNVPSHPYPMYPHVPMRRMPEPIIDPYQRSNQPNFNPYQNQYIPSYGPVAGNCMPSKIYPYPPEMSSKTFTATKLPYDINNKFYVDYENVRNKMYPSVDNITHYNDRQNSSKGDIALSVHPGINVHHIPQHHMYRKENMPMKTFETLHYRGIDPSLYVNNTLPRHPLQFSPVIAKSPADPNIYNEVIPSLGTLQEDCGYVSQSSTTSGRSIDSENYKIQNELYRKHNNSNLYGSTVKNTPKHFSRSHSENGTEKKGLDVRQFLQMWNEGEDDVSESNNTPANSNMFTQSETISNPEQLVVLGLVNIPNEELSKYEHIQKISKLPENIKGYNSIELLDQYEQLIETPALRHHKKIVQHEYQFSPKSLAKQSSQLPRPISPLDVEAKISQSVIHKEVGCNFEIKPCSPKMMNIEVATPVQNIMDERTIEKVLNRGITNSPLLPSRSENVSRNSPSTSCKMNSPYISNNDLMTKNNYSLQDLEINSGVCLASLPRLDSDIELNFPEINQQFIDANRYNTNPCQPNSDISVNNSCKNEQEFNKDLTDLNKSSELNTSIETAKLSKYRKIKLSDSLLDNKLNHTANSRTDSVIIKNPENMRKTDEIVSSVTTMEKTEKVQEKELKNIGEITVDTNSLQDLKSSAIDFSINKMTHNITNSNTENLILNSNVMNFNENDCKVNNYIPNDVTQLDVLSLVTKKVEMELKEFERNENHSKNDQKIIDCSNCEDIDTLPNSIRKNDENSIIPQQTNTELQSVDITNEDKNSYNVCNNSESHMFLNINDIDPYNSQITIQEETQDKSDSLPKVEEMFKDEVVIATLKNTTSNGTIIKDINDDIVEITESEPRIHKDTKINALDLEPNMLGTNQNSVKECEDSSRELICANNHGPLEDPVKEVNVLTVNQEYIAPSKILPPQLVAEDKPNEFTGQKETENTVLINNNYVCIGTENGEKSDIKISEKKENVDNVSIKEEQVKDDYTINPTNVNLNESSSRDCNTDVNRDGDSNLSIHDDRRIGVYKDIIIEREIIIEKEYKNTQAKEPQHMDLNNCEDEVSEEIIAKNEHAAIELSFTLQQQESVMNLDQSDSEIRLEICTTESTKIDHDKINVQVNTKQITSQENLIKENKCTPAFILKENNEDLEDINLNGALLPTIHSKGLTDQGVSIFEENVKVHLNNLQTQSTYSQPKGAESSVADSFENIMDEKYKTTGEISSVFKWRSEVKSYLRKELFSPWIQKLFIFNEGNCESGKYYTDIKVDVAQAKESLETQKYTNENSDPKSVLVNVSNSIVLKESIDIVTDMCERDDNNGTREAVFVTSIAEVEEKLETKKVTNDNVQDAFTSINSDSKSILDKFSNTGQMLLEESIDISDSCEKCISDETHEDIACIAEVEESLEKIDVTNENVQDSYTTFNPDSKSNIEQCGNTRHMLIHAGINVRTDLCKKEDDQEIQEGVTKSIDEENGMNLTIIMNNETVEGSENSCLFNPRLNLKRSLSDSALDLYSENGFIDRASYNKRRKFITEDLLGCSGDDKNVCEYVQNNRRKSVSGLCDNENVLILIDDNAYVLAQDDDDSNKLCDTPELFNASNNIDVSVSYESEESVFKEITMSNVDYEHSVKDKTVQEAWVDGVDCIENIFNDDVAVDITIGAPLSPENSSLSSSDNYNEDSICSENESEHIVKIKEIYGDNMDINDVQIVETLYKMPQMDVNKTLVDIEPQNLQKNQNEVKASSNSSKKRESPNRFDSLEKPQSVSCNELKILCDKENKDASLHLNSLNFSNDVHVSAEDKLLNNQKSEDDIDSCKSECTSLINNYRYTMSSSPEVSSTTTEEKISGISFNITNRNVSSKSEINNILQNVEEVRYKYNEKNDYTSNYRPLITKAAQKYIPPLIESEDLKVKLPLPQQSLNKLKELKLAKKKFLSNKSNIRSASLKQGVTKKVKPKFEDVLKSIDEIQFKKHREMSKKAKHTIPKVVIKKNENGAHYASTPMKESSYNPDLTGRKWQPWVFIERNELVDRMAQRNKRKAIYCHRKKTFVLEEKFKKYKSICTAKFVISQPASDNVSSGNLKYTIRLKHNC